MFCLDSSHIYLKSCNCHVCSSLCSRCSYSIKITIVDYNNNIIMCSIKFSYPLNAYFHIVDVVCLVERVSTRC